MLLLLFAGIQRHLEGELAGIDLADIEDAFQQVDFCRSAGCGASVDSVRDLRMPCGFCAAKCRSRIVRSVDERVYLRRLQFIYQLQDFRHHVVPLRRNVANPFEAEGGDPPAGELGVGIELGNLGKSLRGLVRGLGSGQVSRNCSSSILSRSLSCSSPQVSCWPIQWFILNPLDLKPSFISRFCSKGLLL